MGCDITIVVEALHDGQWAYVPGCPDRRDRLPDPHERCYAAYGFLAGIRGEGDHIGGRGIPKDGSGNYPWDGDRMWAMNFFGHTHATVGELMALPWPEASRCWGFLAWLNGDAMGALVETHGPEGVRVLMTFDD